MGIAPSRITRTCRRLDVWGMPFMAIVGIALFILVCMFLEDFGSLGGTPTLASKWGYHNTERFSCNSTLCIDTSVA
jgi:hypothetical protein